jgi:hypothetical protein
MPKSISELKANITRKMKNISKDVLKRVFLIFLKIFDFVFSSRGGHFENIRLTFDTENYILFLL